MTNASKKHNPEEHEVRKPVEVQLQKLQYINADLKTQGERISLEDELRAIISKYSDDKQVERILSPPIVYDSKGPKNTTREKIALEREMDKIAQLAKQEKASQKEVAQGIDAKN